MTNDFDVYMLRCLNIDAPSLYFYHDGEYFLDELEKLKKFIGIYGEPDKVIEKLAPICTDESSAEALETLKTISKMLEGCEEKKNIRFDFSIVNDMRYYSGIVFGGFVEGICESVLLGGQYGSLMQKMGRRSDAVGFAIYLDLLEGLGKEGEGFDVDVLLICKKGAKPEAIAAKVDALVAAGKSVSAQSAVPEKLRYKEIIEL